MLLKECYKLKWWTWEVTWDSSGAVNKGEDHATKSPSNALNADAIAIPFAHIAHHGLNGDVEEQEAGNELSNACSPEGPAPKLPGVDERAAGRLGVVLLPRWDAGAQRVPLAISRSSHCYIIPLVSHSLHSQAELSLTQRWNPSGANCCKKTNKQRLLPEEDESSDVTNWWASLVMLLAQGEYKVPPGVARHLVRKAVNSNWLVLPKVRTTGSRNSIKLTLMMTWAYLNKSIATHSRQMTRAEISHLSIWRAGIQLQLLHLHTPYVPYLSK